MDEAMEQEDDAQKGASGQLATTKVPLAQSQPIVVPPLSSGATRLENVEADLMHWYCLDADAQTALLKSVSENDKFSHEALVHICRQAYEDKDKKTFDLAFAALAKSASPLLLKRAWGKAVEREDQVQEIFLHVIAVFKASEKGQKAGADFAETRFLTFAKRRAISLYRAKKNEFENVDLREQSYDDTDPIDDVVDPTPNAEAMALFNCSIDKLQLKHRLVFIQFNRLGLSQEEMAKHHGVDVRTIRNWLKAANAALGISGGKK